MLFNKDFLARLLDIAALHLEYSTRLPHSLRAAGSKTRMKPTLLILNGPGLGDLSDYSGHWYGDLTLEEIRKDCQGACDELGFGLDFRQTDDQDEMFRWIAKDSETFDGVIINPVGHSREMIMKFERYRSAIQVIASLKKPVIEVHLTNIYREIKDVTQPLHEPEGDMGFICGFGKLSYVMAVRTIAGRLHAAAAASAAT